jgi:hypothetical protein
LPFFSLKLASVERRLKELVTGGPQHGIHDGIGNVGYVHKDAVLRFTNNRRYLEFFEKKLLSGWEDDSEEIRRFEYKIKDIDRNKTKNKLIITRVIKRFIRHGLRQRAENYIINSLFMLRVYFKCKEVSFNSNKNLSYFRPYIYLYERPQKKHLKKIKPNIIVTKFMLNERKRISHCSRLVHAAICRKQYLFKCDSKTAIFPELYKSVTSPENSLTFKNFIGLSRERRKFRVHRFVTGDIRPK